MEGRRRKGLRISFIPQPTFRMSNAERCKDYRDSLLRDPDRLEVYKQKYRERNRQNRSRTVSEEEAQRRRELARLRQQKCRERKRAERLASEAEHHQQPAQKKTTQKSQKKLKAAVEAKRAKWREQQQNRRANWNAQKRRHREKSLAYYHKNKELKRLTDGAKTDRPPASQTAEHPASQQEGATEPAPASQQEGATEHSPAPLPQQSPSCGPQPDSSSIIHPGDLQAFYRAKKAIMDIKPHLFAPLMMEIHKQIQKSPQKQKALNEIAGNLD